MLSQAAGEVKGELAMRRLVTTAIIGALASVFFAGVQAQSNSATNPPTAVVADPYANNAAPGTTRFPLAAPAGVNSNAVDNAPAAGANQGHFSPGA
jgi:hypothetical protein